jgi:hypothetical protein
LLLVKTNANGKMPALLVLNINASANSGHHLSNHASRAQFESSLKPEE